LRRRDRFWRWVRRDLNNRHECWLGPCPSIGHFAVVACYRGVHLPPPREQQAAVDPILPRHLGDIGSLRETLGQDPSLLLRRPAPPAPATADQFDPAVALPIMLVLMPIMKQRTIPLFKKQGTQSTARRTSARWGPHAAIMQALILVAESGGPTMLARIGVMRALNRHIERVFNSDRKETHWGKRKLKRDQ